VLLFFEFLAQVGPGGRGFRQVGEGGQAIAQCPPRDEAREGGEEALNFVHAGTDGGAGGHFGFVE
jgi:hypothetical protein